MKNNRINYKSIPGWGMDADPDNEPTYPMKNYTGDDHHRINYERSLQQTETVEILQSNERPALSVVFGTAIPPSGLSGRIRHYAFTHSEDRYRHWMPLLIADRIQVFEGIIDDFRKGYFPNIFAEKGWKAAWKYNKKSLITKVGITASVAVFIMLSLQRKK